MIVLYIDPRTGEPLQLIDEEGNVPDFEVRVGEGFDESFPAHSDWISRVPRDDL